MLEFVFLPVGHSLDDSELRNGICLGANDRRACQVANGMNGKRWLAWDREGMYKRSVFCVYSKINIFGCLSDRV
ncbi:hypothetical protein PNK_0142 [Candidatus Protochlamydia naegleriophila]|uniref:Uncharacterized protein n=1 Tax=Candidatus Protochlamydia naegleriophila TaxID=389348 RepID=A0A0U5JAI2_9BACT|nr:hypothetical protein PNK_0142 [Candidatus Protochlamydia naegleriophila]